jgi:hypothetical protein
MVISVASDNNAQLHTLEGFAAAMLMVGTVYLVVSAVTLSVPQTELHVDAQLKAYGQDALNVLDTSLPPENNRSYYSSVLKNSVVGWMNGVEGATSFETDELRVKHSNGTWLPYTSYKFEFAGPLLHTNKTFKVYIPNNTQISHAYITLTGMPLLNITDATTPQIKYEPKNPNDPLDQFGCAIAYGDLNDDTVSDLVVGAYGNNSSSGAVYVYYGNNSSIGAWETDGPNVTITNPGASGDHFGWAVACGDVNGDGVDDLIVGAPENGTTDTGAVYVYNGPILTDTPVPDVTIQNPRTKGLPVNGRFGCSLACGDVNGDSFGDILIGAPTAREYVADCGNAFVYFGGNPFSGNKITLYNPYNSSDFFGISVASVDINGDGLSDIVIGANAANRTYIRYGSASFPPVINGAYNNEMNLTLYGVSSSDFGISVSRAGDVNNDGVCDLIVGAPANDSAHIFYGGSHPDNTSDINLTGESSVPAMSIPTDMRA